MYKIQVVIEVRPEDGTSFGKRQIVAIIKRKLKEFASNLSGTELVKITAKAIDKTGKGSEK